MGSQSSPEGFNIEKKNIPISLSRSLFLRSGRQSVRESLSPFLAPRRNRHLFERNLGNYSVFVSLLLKEL